MIENDMEEKHGKRCDCIYIATNEVANMMVAMFESMDNEYFKERAADVKDVTFRLKCNLLGACRFT